MERTDSERHTEGGRIVFHVPQSQFELFPLAGWSFHCPPHCHCHPMRWGDGSDIVEEAKEMSVNEITVTVMMEV